MFNFLCLVSFWIAMQLFFFLFQILNSSMRLLGGETLACPNFMCKEIFMQKELKRFLEHTIHCRPLYFCANCNKKCASNSNLITHQKVCIGTAVKLMQVSRIFEDSKIYRYVVLRSHLLYQYYYGYLLTSYCLQHKLISSFPSPFFL